MLLVWLSLRPFFTLLFALLQQHLFVQPVCWREIFHGHKAICQWLWYSRELVYCGHLRGTDGSLHCQLLSHLVSVL